MKKLIAFLFALTIVFSLTLSAAAIDGGAAQDNGETPANAARDDGEPAQDPDDEDQQQDSMDSQEIGGIIKKVKDKLPGGGSEAATEATEEATAPTESATETPEPTVSKTTVKNESADESEEDEPENTLKIVLIVIAVIVVLLILTVVMIMKSKKKLPGISGDIIIEVLSGLCYNTDFAFSLKKELTIGTDRSCDLVFSDAQALPLHAVIRREGDTVIIREYGDVGKTYVGGMKIFGSNRLRSGDIVTVGVTSFRVVF